MEIRQLIIKNACNNPLQDNTCQIKQQVFSWLFFIFAISLLFPILSFANSIDDGTAYLETSQQADGSWVSTEVRQIHATTEVLLSLQAYGDKASTRIKAADFLATDPTFDVDALARRIIALSTEGRDVTSDVNQLLAAADQLGGWGLKQEYSAAPLDTALALSALVSAGYADLTEFEEALFFLVNSQNQDGGWACVEWAKHISPSDVSCTAQILLTLTEYRTLLYVEGAISAAQAFLKAQIQSDGILAGFLPI